MRFLRLDTPIGSLTVASDGQAVTSLQFPNRKGEPFEAPGDWIEDPAVGVLGEAAAQLEAYFAGARTEFDLPLRPVGTPFQLKVWDQLCRIQFGETISYGELARRVGNFKASRAVGMANGRNPIAVFIPCHRVIGADGSLTGFGGGVDVKRKLLELEGATFPAQLFAQA